MFYLLISIVIVVLGLSVVFAIAYRINKKAVEYRATWRDNKQMIALNEEMCDQLKECKILLEAVRINNLSYRHLQRAPRERLDKIIGIADPTPPRAFKRYKNDPVY